MPPLKKIISWRVLTGFLGLAIAVGSLFLLSQSELLAVENIEVEGNKVIPTEEIMNQAGPLLYGKSLLAPSFEDVDELLSAHPFAEDVEIERDFPNTVRIRVREHRPFINLRMADGKIMILSADGKALVSADIVVQELPVLSTKEPCQVEIGRPAECEDAATGVWFLANIPVNFNHEFAEVSVSEGDISARTVSGAKIHFGTLDEFGLKFEVLRQLLARASGAGADVSIDVSVPERPVTRDDASPAPQAETPADGEEMAEPFPAETPVDPASPPAGAQETGAAAGDGD